MTRYHLIPWAMAIILVTVLFTMDGTCQAHDRTAVRDTLEVAMHVHRVGTIRCHAGDCHAHYSYRGKHPRVCRGYFTITRNVDGPELIGPGVESDGWTGVTQYFERCHDVPGVSGVTGSRA